MSREEELKQESVVEAVLFTMGKSVELRQLAAALDTDEDTARAAVERLMQRYLDENRGMQIIELEKSYQMCTRSEYYDQLVKVAKTPKKQTLTDVVLETLSIIAYKQPVTKAEIEKIRGVSSDHAVNRLIEYGLVYEAGRLDAPGRPALFATTEEFLRRFGVESKKNLPEVTPDQEAEIVHEVEEEVNYKFGTEPDEAEDIVADDTGIRPETETGTEAGTETGTEAGTETGTEAGTETETGIEIGPETGTETETETEKTATETTEAVTDTETFAEAESTAETESVEEETEVLEKTAETESEKEAQAV